MQKAGGGRGLGLGDEGKYPCARSPKVRVLLFTFFVDKKGVRPWNRGTAPALRAPFEGAFSLSREEPCTGVVGGSS